MRFLKSILVVLLLSICILSYGQNVFKFRAYQTAIILKGEDASKAVYKNSNTLMVLDYDKLKVSIYNKEEDVIDLIAKEVDEEKDGMHTYLYTGVDKYGNKVIVSLTIEKAANGKQTAFIILGKNNYTVFYRVKTA